MARARQRSWRWPWERLRPPSVIGEVREVKRFLFFCREGVEVPDADGVVGLVGGMSCTRSRASRSSESE